MEKNIKLYMLKDNTFLIGELKGLKLVDAMFLGVEAVRDKENGQTMQIPMCFPLGFPVNQKPIEINLDNLDIFFEVQEIQRNIMTVYEDTLLQLQNPNIIIPGTNKIKLK